MPSFDFATLQIPFGNHLVTTLVQPCFLHTQWGKCMYWKAKVPEGAGRIQLNVLCQQNFGVPNLQMNGGLVKAAALVEQVQSDEGKVHDLKVCNEEAGAFRSSGDDSDEMDDREKLRRSKISKANKGKVPWNKGRKHSEETRQKIQERTKLAMQDPKVKMKLVKLGHAQSVETRVKIGQGVRMGWERRRKWLSLQETCFLAWQNAIADASRKGFAGEDELQWDSYDILNKQLKVQWLDSVEQRKLMPRSNGGKRAPKSPEQRRKISQAISAKWADPEYRERVCSALAKYHGIPDGVERRSRRKPQGESQGVKRERPIRKTSIKTGAETHLVTRPVKTVSIKKKMRRPSFKDPLVGSKLEMIKNIREERATMEIKKREAVQRAKLLIAEAEKAARALEVAARTNPIACASLSQTRKLIAEATQSIQGIEGGSITAAENLDSSSVLTSSDEESQMDFFSDEIEFIDKRSNKRAINGACHSSLADQNEEFDFTKFALHNLLNSRALVDKVGYSQGNAEVMVDGLKQQLSISLSSPDGLNGSRAHDKVKLEDDSEDGNCSPLEEMTKNLHPKTMRKKQWVCGKLVEVESS
ncbi:uncharacterized protein LOC116257656 isoform X1 [Nymphaea colorata]|nr:uncharacterized protein LOC116257656 isoform X1 [Nymphaea colorata]